MDDDMHVLALRNVLHDLAGITPAWPLLSPRSAERAGLRVRPSSFMLHLREPFTRARARPLAMMEKGPEGGGSRGDVEGPADRGVPTLR
jgi:hypothetical protein